MATLAASTERHWRREARAVIAKTLANLPADTTENDASKQIVAVVWALLHDEYNDEFHNICLQEETVAMHCWRRSVDVAAFWAGSNGGLVKPRIAPKVREVVCATCIMEHLPSCFGCAGLRQTLEARRETTDWLFWW